MRKILIFSLAYYPHVGGAEVAIKELTDRLDDIEFHMVTMRWSAADPVRELVGRVHVHRVGFVGSSIVHKFLFQLFASHSASKLHAQHSFDAVWAMMAHSAGVPAALFKLRHSRVPMLLTLQEGDPPEKIERTMLPLWPLFARAFTRADRIQGISNFLGQWARKRNFSGPLVVVPNGVDLKHFMVPKMPHDGVVLVTASRLVHKNAVDDIIRALALLPDSIRLSIAGTGSDEPMLRTIAKEEGVAKRVEFLGHIDHAHLPALLQRSDIFIRPSRSEGMGNAFIEAMAVGLPVIGTAVGGIPDFLKDGDTGYVVEVDNPKSIAAAVERIVAQPYETRAITGRAQELARQYDWDILARRMREEAFEPLWQNE